MEFPRDEGLDFAQCRGVNVCETVNLGVHRRTGWAGAQGRGLANMECECKHELVIVAQLENEVRCAGYRLGILQDATASQPQMYGPSLVSKHSGEEKSRP